MTFLATAEDVLTAVGMKAVNASEIFRNVCDRRPILCEECGVFSHDALGTDEARSDGAGAHPNTEPLLDVLDDFVSGVNEHVVLGETGLGDDVGAVVLTVRGVNLTLSFAAGAGDLDVADFHNCLR